MKHRISKRVALALAMCVTCVLAFGATFVRADVNSKPKVSNLTIKLAGSDSGDSQVKDLGTEAELYLVAYANPDDNYDTYNYDFEGTQFESLKSDFNQQTYTSDDWKELVGKVKAFVDDKDNNIQPDKTVKVGDPIDLQNGLYLVIIPNTANDKYSFTFEPVLVSLPGKTIDPATQQPYTTTDKGEWTNDVTATYRINVKWSMEPRKGGLKINKTVSSFNGEPATFTFLIEGKTDAGDYQNYAAVQFDSAGVHSTTVNGIPAGYEYTVTEIDSGAGYQTDGANAQKVTVVADQTADVQTAEVSFNNVPNDSGKQGYGIENHFVFDRETGNWNPEKREINKPSNSSNE